METYIITTKLGRIQFSTDLKNTKEALTEIVDASAIVKGNTFTFEGDDFVNKIEKESNQ